MKKRFILLIFLLLILLLIISYFYFEISKNEIEITSFIVPEKLYISVNNPENIKIIIEEKNKKEVKYKLISEDESILKTSDNSVLGLKDGKTKIIVNAQNGETKEIEVVVTSLITKPKIDNEKPFIKCGEYSKEEESLLEEILEYKIKEAGYTSRGAAVSAARFLILEFKSGIRYFNENGRLENHSSILKIDGEGRYYHKGLYLTEDKYKNIEYSTSSGPKTWGCPLHNNYQNKEMENGLNCSGFITWVLYNAGYDIKDVGAGDFDYINNELLDIKPKMEITKELLNSGKVKVGDLIGKDGHIAMIIGLEEDKIYVGESYYEGDLIEGLRVRIFSKEELISSDFTDIILMDDFYKNEGIYNNMW